MIKLHQEKRISVTKQNKRTFIPFQNERDSLGRIIRPKTQQKNDFNILQMFQNLKKSTKQYFFQKEFHKLQKRFQNAKRNLQDDKSYNYVKDINLCIDLMDELKENREERQKNKQNLYVNLRENIDNKIHCVKSQIKKHKNQRVKNIQTHYILRNVEASPKKINIELFKSIGNRSQMMATFCQKGLQYNEFVQQKKQHPWKKWYKNKEYELFPGKRVKVKELQKSIY